MRLTPFGFFLTLIIGLASTAVLAEPKTPAWLSGVDVSLVELRLNKPLLRDFFDLVRKPTGEIYLPADDIFRAAEATVDNPSAKVLSIALESTGESLRIDLETQTLRINGQSGPATADDAFVLDGRIFVAEALLAGVFGLTFTYDNKRQRVGITSARPLPIDLREARNKRWSRFDSNEAPTSSLMPLAYDYGLLDAPQTDFRLTTTTGQNGAMSSQYDLLAIGEMAGLTQRLFMSGRQGDALAVTRWNAGRRDPQGNLLGMAKLQEFALGDVSGFGSALLGPARGRGIRMQTAPLLPASNFDSTVIRGDAPPGWDAELYVGASLVDFKRIDVSGQYVFPEVALRYGSNDIRVVLYGPNGQTRQVNYQQSVSSGTLLPGDFNVYAHLLQSDVDMFAAMNSRLQGTGEVAAALRVDYGLSRWLTASTELIRAPYDMGHTALGAVPVKRVADYAGLELRPNLNGWRLVGGMKVQATGFADPYTLTPATTEAGPQKLAGLQGRHAFYANFAVPLFGLTLSGQTEHYGHGFSSNRNGTGSQATRQLTELNTYIPIGSAQANAGQVLLGLQNRSLRDGTELMKYQLAYQHAVSAVYFGHSLEATRSRYNGSAWLPAAGFYRGLASFRHDAFDLRAELFYQLGQQSRFQSLGVYGRWRQSDAQAITAGLMHGPTGHAWSLGWSQILDYSRFMLSFSGGYSQGGGYNIGTALSFSFGPHPSSQFGWVASSRPQAESGRADVFVFEDKNFNGLYEPGTDLPIANAAVMVNRRAMDQRTDEGGRVLVDSLAALSTVDVELDPQALPDPFMVPMVPGYQLRPRAGKLMALMLPVTEGGELGGSLKLMDGRPLGRVRLQLIHPQGHIQQETATLSDGFFMFNKIYPGQWRVRLSPEQNVPGVQLDSTPVALTFTDKERFRDDFHLHLRLDDKKRATLVVRDQDQKPNQVKAHSGKWVSGVVAK